MDKNAKLAPVAIIINQTAMTQTKASPLPSQFSIGNIVIQSIAEIGVDFFLYNAIDPEGENLLVREFCPHTHAQRQDNQEITAIPGDEAIFEEARLKFEQTYLDNAQGKMRGHGTVYFIYPSVSKSSSSSPTPSVAHAQGLKPKNEVAHAQGLKRPSEVPQEKTHSTTPTLQKTHPDNTPKPTKLKASPVGTNAPLPPRSLNSSSSGNGSSGGLSPAPFVIAGLALVIGFFVYNIMEETPLATAVEVPTIEKPKEKEPEPVVEVVEIKEEPPVEIAEVEPEPEQGPEPEPEPEPDLAMGQDVVAMEVAIRNEALKNNGKLSDKLLAKYPIYAEAWVRNYIKKRGGSFSKDFETWLTKTNTKREIFANYYPPDPNVATNAAMLVDSLGLETAEKYHQMVIAFAVGRREFGMGAFDLGHQGRFGDAKGKLQELINSGIMLKPAEAYCKGEAPVNWYGNAPDTVSESTYQKLAEYLVKKNLAPKQAWEDRKNVVKELDESNISENSIASYLHEYMYRNNMLKRKRDPFPTPIEYFAYLVDKYENHKKLRTIDRKRIEWQGLALDGTPWPVMIPLSETRPLRECDSVWERLLGQRGEPRVWLYGPYRMDDDPQPPILFSFDPDPEWSRQSNERKLHEGGVCGTMSLISRNSQIARGIPAAPAGQPGHGNLMVTHFTSNGCWLTVEQSVDTLKATSGGYYMGDSSAARGGGAEYSSGMALAMNLDYEKFLASRFAMNIYKLAGTASCPEASEGTSEAENEDFKKAALRSVLDRNPFHTEAWYSLTALEPSDLLNTTKLLDELHKRIPVKNGIKSLWKKNKIANRATHGHKSDDDAISNSVRDYLNVLSAVAIEKALEGKPAYSTRDWHNIMNWCKVEKKNNSYPEIESAYHLAYANSQGTDRLKRNIDRGFKLAKHFYREDKNTLKVPDAKDVNQAEMGHAIDAICRTLPKEEILPWMKEILDACPDGFKYQPKNKNETKIQHFYDRLTTNYLKLADSTECEQLKADMKEASTAILDLSKGKKQANGRSRRQRD